LQFPPFSKYWKIFLKPFPSLLTGTNSLVKLKAISPFVRNNSLKQIISFLISESRLDVGERGYHAAIPCCALNL
jgi:hypothetical protein